MIRTRRELMAVVIAVGLAMSVTAQDKPPHVVEKTDKKAGVDTFARGLPIKVASEPNEDMLLADSKLFMSRMPSGHGDLRFRDLFDPRYLKKHGLADKDIAFEVIDSTSFRGIHNIQVADDKQTVLCTIDTKDGKELFILRWVVYEGHLYISPEKAPDPKTGIFKPWILRSKAK